MYDAIDDPYTYDNSTVLVNKLGLRGHQLTGRSLLPFATLATDSTRAKT